MRKYLSFKVCGGGDIYTVNGLQKIDADEIVACGTVWATLYKSAIEEFVEKHNKNPGVWRSILGGTLQTHVCRKMPVRLAKFFSVQFQNKESQPQLSTWAFQIILV